MIFTEGHYYTLTEDNGVEKTGFTFKCENVRDDGMAEYGTEKYRVMTGMCREATAEEIIITAGKETGNNQHPL